jgi:hypothetical protein
MNKKFQFWRGGRKRKWDGGGSERDRETLCLKVVWQKNSSELLFFFWLFPSPGILGTRKHDVSETGSVSVLRSGGEKTSTHLGPLDRANLNHWTSGAAHLRTKTDPVSETSCFLAPRITDDGKSKSKNKKKQKKKKAILSVIHHCQNPLQSKGFPALEVPRQCPIVLLVEVYLIWRRVKHWEVKNVKGYEVDFVVRRGENLNRGICAYDWN